MSTLRAWRKHQNPPISQETLANMLSTTQSHVSEIENAEDKVSLELAGKIFAVTGERVGKMKDASIQDATAVGRVMGGGIAQ